MTFLKIQNHKHKGEEQNKITLRVSKYHTECSEKIIQVARTPKHQLTRKDVCQLSWFSSHVQFFLKKIAEHIIAPPLINYRSNSKSNKK